MRRKVIRKCYERGFTLVELLVVIGIVAALSTAVVLVINPAELVKQSRDSRRIQDLKNINTALSIFKSDQFDQSLGEPNTVYLSLPDTSPNCSNLNLPTLPEGWVYRCVTEANVSNIDGTGWIPVNFSLIFSGSPLSKLPLDPVNDASEGYYYVYVTNGDRFELDTVFESKKYLAMMGNDGGDDISRFETGQNLALLGPITLGTFLFNSQNENVFFGINKVYAQSGNAGQISFFIDASHIGGDSNLLWDNTNKVLSIGGAAGSNYRVSIRGTDDSTSNFSLFTGGANTTGLVVRNDGNVGVGINSPSLKLEVYGSGSDGVAKFRDVNNGVFGSILIGIGKISSDMGNFNFGNGKVFFSSDGNVGIGTTTPQAKLDIYQGNLDLDNTTYTNQSGVITKNGIRFIHDFNYGNNGTVTTGGYNLFIGMNAGNFTMGSTATQSQEASYNVGVGSSALYSNTTGYRNTAVGYATLFSNTTGYYNTAVGYAVLYSNTTGIVNTAVGYSVLYSNTTGIVNTAVGSSALYSNTTGSYNSAVGYSSLSSNTTGNYNSAVGYSAGRYIANGSSPNQTSNNSVYIGSYTKALADGDTNEIVIGYNVTGAGSNSVVLGNDSITKTILKGNVALGVSDNNPTAKVDIQGSAGYNQLRLRTSYTPTGTSDANGNVGDIAWDDNYIYVKTSAGWKRAALSSW